jgi:hypothetical protein
MASKKVSNALLTVLNLVRARMNGIMELPLLIRSLAIGTCFGAKLKNREIISRWSDLVELLQPPIGLNESLVFGGAAPAADRS